jgi:LytS/YehU family sensor histidine kinase
MRRWATVPINGFGLMLLALVVTDAQRRTDSERRRLEAEAARATALRAQLSAVRARVHPHFLFNTLNAIAEMCVVCPERAEAATLKLSALMRRTLDAGAGSLAPLAEEIEATRTYLDIEKERLGSRLQVVWDVPADLRSVSAPPFSLQPLVENAVVHGVSRREGQGTVRIRVRVRPSGTSVLVGDDGVGMPEAVVRSALANAEEPADGLSMVQCQLRMAFGPKGRLRVCSRPGQGTIVAFRIPARPSGRLETGAPA